MAIDFKRLGIAVSQLVTAGFGLAAAFGYIAPGDQLAMADATVGQLMGLMMTLATVLPGLFDKRA